MTTTSILSTPPAAPPGASPARTPPRPADIPHRSEAATCQINLAAFGKHAIYWMWTICTKAIVFIVYQDVVTTSIIYLFPEMGKRLWKVPFFAFLNDYEITHRITLAHCFVVIPVICTFILWNLLFRIYLAKDRFDAKFKRFDVQLNGNFLVRFVYDIFS